MKIFVALRRHKWRYVAFVFGFLLFVSPPALLIRAAYHWMGSSANTDLHKACFRMPWDWIFTGDFAIFEGRYFLIFFIIVGLVVAFFLGPLFCGWLCPVGSSSETLSRLMPRKCKINLSRKINPAALRYGFLASFVLVSVLAAYAAGLGLAGICCRFCAASQFQNIANAIFHPSEYAYWHSGGIMVIGTWLILGGIFWQGGRGWCLYACPFGAVSNIFHFAGSKLGLTYKIKHDPTNCTECHKCEDVCPTWAIKRHSKEVDINRHTCNTCLECVKVCHKGCYKYERG